MYACWDWGCLRVLRAWGRLGLIRLPPYGSRLLYDRTLTHLPTVLPASHGSQQLFIPQSLVDHVLRVEHSSSLASHPGGSRMYQTMRNHYYGPSMAADVFGWVAACPT